MRFAPLVLAALCAAVLFTGLDRIGWIDEREARDAEVARELVQRHEVLTPLYAHEPRFDKPLFGYALEAIGQVLTPGSPHAARTARAIAALALVLLTALIGARQFGPRAGWCAAAVLVTALGVPLATHTDGTQMLASLLAWVGCAGLADAVFGRAEGRTLRLVTAYGALGVTLLVAGPLPALWPIAALALYLRLARPAVGWRAVRPVIGAGIIVAFAIPWYAAMIAMHDGAFLAHAPFFPYGMQPRGPWYAGLPLAMAFLVLGAFPWSALLPGAALHAAVGWRLDAVRRMRALAQRVGPASVQAAEPRVAQAMGRERREEGAAHFFICALAAALLPIVFYASPPLSAVLPALPAAALLCGRYLDHLFEDPERVRAALANATRMLALIGTVGAIQCVLLAPRLREAGPAVRMLGATLLLTSWAPFLADLIRRRRVAAMLMVLPVAIGVPVTTLRLLPRLEDYLNTRSVAEAMREASPSHAPLLLVEPAPPSLRVYSARSLVLADSLRPALAAYRATDSLAYVAFRPSRERDVARRAGVPLEILMRTPSLVLARVRP